jgi:catechol 2,3-dioxygenase-like lactoylglutathione lyase family enzyme
MAAGLHSFPASYYAMIDHLIVSVSDLKASKTFYGKALAPLGYKTSAEYTSGSTKTKGVGFGVEDLEFFIVQGSMIKPPVHLAFRAKTRAEVKAFYEAAIAADGRDNGAPELTPEHHADYFSAYVFDPDGHNIEAVCHESE